MEKTSRGESYPLPKWQAIGFKKIQGAPQRTKAKTSHRVCSPVCCSAPRSAEWSYVKCHSGWETQVRVGRGSLHRASCNSTSFTLIHIPSLSWCYLSGESGVRKSSLTTREDSGSWVRKTWLNPSSSAWLWTWVISLSFLNLSFFTIMTSRVVIGSEWPWED